MASAARYGEAAIAVALPGTTGCRPVFLGSRAVCSRNRPQPVKVSQLSSTRCCVTAGLDEIGRGPSPSTAGPVLPDFAAA